MSDITKLIQAAVTVREAYVKAALDSNTCEACRHDTHVVEEFVFDSDIVAGTVFTHSQVLCHDCANYGTCEMLERCSCGSRYGYAEDSSGTLVPVICYTCDA